MRLIEIQSRFFRVGIFFLLMVSLGQPLHAEEPKETKRVLILYSEDKDHPAHQLTDRGIRETFQSNKRFDLRLYTEYLDLSRFAAPSQRRLAWLTLGWR